MCLAIPAQLIEILNEREGIAAWSEISRKVALDLVPGVKQGDWILVHTGYAIQVLDPEQARESLTLFQEMLDEPE